MSVVAIIILAVSIVASEKVKANPQSSPEVFHQTDSLVTNSPVPSQTSASHAIATVLPHSTPLPVKNTIQSNSNDFIYPDSTLISSSPEKISLSSTDNPDTITNWYKDKLKSMNFNINSFITTRANQKTQNKLVSSDSRNSYVVDISQQNTSNPVYITISIAGL
jgi:hypothetical protein